MKKEARNKDDLYTDLGKVMGDLEADDTAIETIIMNSKNETANRYLRETVDEIKRVLSDMSEALFEITTSPIDGE